MDDITFNKLTKKELYEGFLHCRKSAEEHRLCARLMAAKEIYGIANSHLILGAEEAIKALLIFFKYADIPLEIDSIKPFFKDHEAKHKLGLHMMLDVIKSMAIPNLAIITSQFVKLAEKKTTVNDSLKSLMPLLRPLDNIDKWWLEANGKKNQGFYVGYCKEWYPTSVVSKEDFKESEANTTHIFELLDMSWPLDASFSIYI